MGKDGLGRPSYFVFLQRWGYVEPVNGRLRLAATDIQNKDAPHGLTQGPLRGGYNGRFYDSKEAVFDNTSWHCVEAMFKLNSLDMKNDKPNADGEVRGWFDGKLVVERTDVVFRSTDFPKMKFNQFLLTPYFGPGLLPRAQTLWIDELAVGTQRIRPVESKKTATGGEASGDRSSARRSQPDATASEKRRVGNWPQFRGPNRGNISPDIGLLRRWPPGGPPLVWKTTGLGSGFSSVSIVDGRIYTQGHIGGAELVFALDEATGRKLWTVTIGPAERVAYPGSRSTPTVDGDFLYLETVAGDVVCLDTRSTQVVWRRHLKEDFQGRPGCWGYAESPLVDGDRVVVTPGGEQAALVALDRRSGRVIWQASVPTNERDNWKHSRDPYADPAVAAYSSVIVTEVKGLRQYIQFMQQGVVGIRADGKFLWREDSSSCEYANCPTPIFHNSYVFSASGWQGAALIRLISEDSEVSTRLVYANNAMRNWYGGFFLHDGYVYGCSNEILMCMNFLTGEVAWKNRSVGMGSVVYADGHFIMRGDKGTVALVEATPDEYREKGRFDQPDRSDRPARTYPVVTGGRLYLRDEGVLLCYDVREGGR